jgi:hypothetical protein
MNQESIFLQNHIAVIWDFDKTLAPVYMQEPLFEHYGIDSAVFWDEVKALPEYYKLAGIAVHEETCYLGHLLSYVEHGKMPGLTNAKLKELGAKIPLFPGLPDFFDRLKLLLDQPQYKEADIQLEHYIVSAGMEAMVQGTPLASKVDGIWASVFIEEPAKPGEDLSQRPSPGEIKQIAGFLDNTTKTRAIFEINKGVNKTEKISVNDTIAPEKRRVPFENMIYIADGPSDIPTFSVVNGNGGQAYAVYNPESKEHYAQALSLQESQRVNQCGPADYTEGSTTAQWLNFQVERIADRIRDNRADRIDNSVTLAPSH